MSENAISVCKQVFAHAPTVFDQPVFFDDLDDLEADGASNAMSAAGKSMIEPARFERLVYSIAYTACKRCNAEKGNCTPEEAEMSMVRKPFRPSFIMYLREYSGTLYDDWKPFLMLN